MNVAESRIRPYTPREQYQFPEGAVVKTHIEIEGHTYPHFETMDFPRSDPWSLKMRRSVRRLRVENRFDGAFVRELGIGDGRNIREIGQKINGAEGVDVEDWRLEAAARNLVTGEKPLGVQVSLWHGDAVDYLTGHLGNGSARFDGWVLMCLPQSPNGLNSADRYDGDPNLDQYRGRWDETGLTLNAAALDNLRQVASSNLRALVIISNRVPPQYRDRVIRETGWEVEGKFRTEHPIQQDPDTGIEWVKRIDDGRRFFEKAQEGLFVPISAAEAEGRRRESLDSGLGRRGLNVYHHLTVYELKPGE